MAANNLSLSNAELTEACFKDLLDPAIWGFGRKRIYIGPSAENTFPNNYSGFGYKNKQGTLLPPSICVLHETSKQQFYLSQGSLP